VEPTSHNLVTYIYEAQCLYIELNVFDIMENNLFSACGNRIVFTAGWTKKRYI
jgi:hypothetical protein